MTFDPDVYWPAMGEWLAGPGAATQEHVDAEGLLRELLPSLGPVEAVLDVGCGRGRLASLLETVLPDARYSGMDIGAAQVAATTLVRPDGDFYTARLQDFAPDRQWDLVICSEVLMHIPPADIQGACNKLKSLAKRWVVTVDWTAPMDGPIAEWNWLHPYESLFGEIERTIPTGMQSIFVVRP